MSTALWALILALYAPTARAAASAPPALEDLVITAPRDRLPMGAVIDPIINQTLLRLLQQRQDVRPEGDAAYEASLGNLSKLTTATGYKLKTRYTELGFLLTEGLAGVKDFQLASELKRVVQLGRNVQTRAAAMVALAYSRDGSYLPMFQGALQDPSPTVRFAAVESLLVLGDSSARFQLANAARDDRSPAVRLYAAQGLWRMGDSFGREVLLRHSVDQDWLARALAAQYLGELGSAEDYRKLFVQLSLESHPSVKIELCGALLRLHGLGGR